MTESQTVSESALSALLSLIDTEDPPALTVLLDQVRGFSHERFTRLVSLAHPASRAAQHLSLLVLERQSPRIGAHLMEWAASDGNLEDGMILVAQAGQPDIDADILRDRLDTLAAEVRPLLATGDSIDRLGSLIHAVRDALGFDGLLENYYHPDNSYLNRVLDRRTGLPISLSVLYILLGVRLDLDIVGIPLPGHFIAGLHGQEGIVYFDPFNGSKLLPFRAVLDLVRQAGQVYTTAQLRPASSLQMVQRTLANLVQAYTLGEDSARAELMQRYLSLL